MDVWTHIWTLTEILTAHFEIRRKWKYGNENNGDKKKQMNFQK